MRLRNAAVLVAGCSILVMACGGGDGGGSGPAVGTLKITTATSGVDFDQDGYSISIDGDPLGDITLNSTLQFENIATGNHTLALSGLAANCTASPIEAPVSVLKQQIAEVTFAISCEANVGSVEVNVTTAGVDLDPDGYAVSIGSRSAAVAANSGATLTDVPSGPRTAQLSGIAANCVPVGGNSKPVTVAFHANTILSFAVNCSANVGTINIIVTASGDMVPGGTFTATISGVGDRPVAINGTTSIADVPARVTSVALGGYGSACTVAGSSVRSVDVPYALSTSVTFSLTCMRTLAFVSSRDGNFEIYSMRSDGSNVVRLTDNAAMDNSPEWSPDGSKLAFVSTRSGNPEIWVMDANGANQTRLTTTTANNYSPSWSPDGTRILFSSDRDGNEDLWVMNADGSAPVRITNDPASDREPRWSASGTRIVFASTRGNGNPDIYVMDAAGTNVIALTSDPAPDYDPSFSSDGGHILFSNSFYPGMDIFVMNSDGSSRVRLTTDGFWNRSAHYSPDNSKIAYTSERDGNPNIYIMNADGTNQHAITSHPFPDISPSWRP